MSSKNSYMGIFSNSLSCSDKKAIDNFSFRALTSFIILTAKIRARTLPQTTLTISFSQKIRAWTFFKMAFTNLLHRHSKYFRTRTSVYSCADCRAEKQRGHTTAQLLLLLTSKFVYSFSQ